MANKEKRSIKRDISNTDKEMIWIEIYVEIGHIIHIVQMVEYNIANILAIEEFEKETNDVFSPNDIDRIKGNIDKKYQELSGKEYTFGRLRGLAEKSVYLKEVDFLKLKKIVEFRNYLVHECFKDSLLKGGLKTIEDLAAFADRLGRYKKSVVQLNNQLIKIFDAQKTKSVLIEIK